MELRYGLISADDHVQEHPEVWTQRLSRTKWGDRIPHLEEQPDGTQRWVVEGQTLSLGGVAASGALMPDRALLPQRWEEVPKAAYDPIERLRAMDADQVDCSVLYPTVAGMAGETFGRITDAELEVACVQAYNDWLIDEWSRVSERFVPQCIVPIHPPEATVAEISRAVARGHCGVIFPAVPTHLRDVPDLNEPEYDPVWTLCEELQIPLCLHAGSSSRIQFPPYEGLSAPQASALEAMTRPVSSVTVMANTLLSPIVKRHPKLKIVFAESSLSWVAYVLETASHGYERQRLRGDDVVEPLEVFRRQCYVTGWYDRSGVTARHFYSTGSILWSTNFPLTTSTWPSTESYLARSFQGVPEKERRQMTVENAAKLYNL